MNSSCRTILISVEGWVTDQTTSVNNWTALETTFKSWDRSLCNHPPHPTTHYRFYKICAFEIISFTNRSFCFVFSWGFDLTSLGCLRDWWVDDSVGSGGGGDWIAHSHICRNRSYWNPTQVTWYLKSAIDPFIPRARTAVFVHVALTSLLQCADLLQSNFVDNDCHVFVQGNLISFSTYVLVSLWLGYQLVVSLVHYRQHRYISCMLSLTWSWVLFILWREAGFYSSFEGRGFALL